MIVKSQEGNLLDVREVKFQSFKGKEFKVAKGSTHPEYSFFTFESEENDFRDKYWNIKDQDIVIDVGSSYGSYALSACAMGATVYAFEPEKTVFHDLFTNIAINEWGNKCFAFNFGMYSSKTFVKMSSYAPHWPILTISEDYKVNTIDKIVELNELTKLDWLKIDVEGAEEHVIYGAMNTIRKLKPKLIVECHVFLNKEIKDNIKSLLLSACDYDIEEVSRPPCIMLCATPKEVK